MKVALLAYGDLMRRSGGNLYDQNLVRALEHLGHRVDVLSLPQGSYAQCAAIGVRRGALEPLNAASWSDYDLFLEDELIHPSMFRGARSLDLERRVPVVSIVHHLRSSESHGGLQDKVHRQLEQRYLSRVDSFVFNSQTTKRTVEQLLDRPIDGLVATPGGDRFEVPAYLDASYLETRSFEDGPLRLLFVGNLVARKGLLQLIEALQEEGRFDWALEVVGGSEHEPAYARSVRRRVQEEGKLRSKVRFLGALEDEQLAERMVHAHVLCVPSQWEGFGIVYLEALAFGLPVVAGRGGAAGEIIVDGKTGFLVDPFDRSSIREALFRLKDRERLHLMARRCIESFETYPGWKETAMRAACFLEGLAAGFEGGGA